VLPVTAHRLAVFAEKTLPRVAFSRTLGMPHEIDADRAADDVRSDLPRHLNLETP
jgi:hypothetical protein